jgi:hypothetical protein
MNPKNRLFVIVLSLICFSCISFPITPQAHAAQTGVPIIDGLVNLISRLSSGTRDVETWVADLFVGIFKVLAYGFIGDPTAQPAAYLNNGDNVGPVGIAGMLSYSISSTFQSPPSIHPIQYLAYEFLPPFANPTYAQTGQILLSTGNFLSLWTITRNVSYIFLICILVVYGFLIMIRSKTDPRTVVTIQMALPQVVIALILITFSYALGGFFIDLTGILLSLMQKMLGVTSWANLGDLARQIVLGLNGISSFAGPVPVTSGGSIGGQLPVANTIPALGSWLLFLLFVVMVFFALVNIFIAVFGEWVNLFLKTAFAPILILLGTLPAANSKGASGFGGWVKSMIGHAIAIPGIAAVLEISRRFALKPTDPQSLSVSSPGILGMQAIEKIAGFGILLMATSVPAAVKEALGVLPSGAVTGAAQRPSDLQKTAGLIMDNLPGIGPFKI